MTVDEIRAAIQEIVLAHEDDPEVQHRKEDELHENVLRAIADGAPNAKELAAEALRTCDLPFSRWYA